MHFHFELYMPFSDRKLQCSKNNFVVCINTNRPTASSEGDPDRPEFRYIATKCWVIHRPRMTQSARLKIHLSRIPGEAHTHEKEQRQYLQPWWPGRSLPQIHAITAERSKNDIPSIERSNEPVFLWFFHETGATSLQPTPMRAVYPS